ncbi:MAG TPA: YkvA family protein [Gemmatimonas sp.]|uniref:YkvA family protein n=1 Tax=Gemmatimonas sp. TaxID=1962908 RepID=UPI002ED847FB
MDERQRPDPDDDHEETEGHARAEAHAEAREHARRRRLSAARRERRARREEAEGRGGAPRRGLKRSVVNAIRQIPSYIRLLIGLFGDRRVSNIDRFMVIAAAAYIISPLDFIPDVIPFLGEVDDVFLLMLSLQRLVERAGYDVLLDHWRGDPRELDDLNLAGIVAAAGFFLPSRLRRRLRKMAGHRG